jgi:type IV pilus biogenesis protein CpaD/CtpE
MRTKQLIMAGLILVFSVSTVSAECLMQWYRRTYQRESNMGAAYEAAKSNQILNPEAGKEPEPVQGLDGEAAEAAMDAYRQSFKTSAGPSRPDYGPAGIGAEGR